MLTCGELLQCSLIFSLRWYVHALTLPSHAYVSDALLCGHAIVNCIQLLFGRHLRKRAHVPTVVIRHAYMWRGVVVMLNHFVFSHSAQTRRHQ